MNRAGNRGFIGLIILVIVGLAALKYFVNWDIFDAASSQQGMNTISYIRSIINAVWSYIGYPITLVWNEALWPILDLGWQSFQAFLEWGKTNASQGV